MGKKKKENTGVYELRSEILKKRIYCMAKKEVLFPLHPLLS
jgi:hypothetical protein